MLALAAFAVAVLAGAASARSAPTPNTPPVKGSRAPVRALQGANSGLCTGAAGTARGSVPATFPVDACVNDGGIWIRDTLDIPLQLSTVGNVTRVSDGSPVDEDDPIAAAVAAALYSTRNLIFPGETASVSVGAAPASATVSNTVGPANAYYIADGIVGVVGGKLGAGISVEQFIIEATRDFLKYQSCLQGSGSSFFRKAFCAAQLYGNLNFAGARLAVKLATKIPALLIAAFNSGKLALDDGPEINKVASGARTIRLGPMVQASIQVNPSSGLDGSTIAVTGVGFQPTQVVAIEFDNTPDGTTTTDQTGSFSTTAQVPDDASAGSHQFEATQVPLLAVSASFTVNGAGGGGGGTGPATFHIQDIFLGGTWVRTDPNDGTWYDVNHTPPNGAYWLSNGSPVSVVCAATAAAYVVDFSDGHTETWNTWFLTADGDWFPSAAAQEVSTNSFNGMVGCAVAG